MNERPQLPALTDPSPYLPNSPLRLLIGEAPMPPTDYGLGPQNRSPQDLPTAPNHPTTQSRGPPLLGKEGSAGLRNCSYSTNQPLNHKLPVLPEEGGTGAQRLVGW